LRFHQQIRDLNMLTSRKLAAEDGAIRYLGVVCKKCGCSERYVSNNNCFECSKRYAKAYDARQRDLIRWLKKGRV
jgi:hypothetical protein